MNFDNEPLQIVVARYKEPLNWLKDENKNVVETKQSEINTITNQLNALKEENNNLVDSKKIEIEKLTNHLKESKKTEIHTFIFPIRF